MQRIHDAFARTRDSGGALIIYITAGDPSLDDTVELTLAAERGGADIIELGIPYSSPVADGPVIQEACRRALEGAAPPSIDELVSVYERAWRDEAAVPVKFGKNESADSLRDLARRMLAAFQASEVSNLDTRLLAIEEEFRAPVIPGCPDLLGRVDLVGCDRSALRISAAVLGRPRLCVRDIQRQ